MTTDHEGPLGAVRSDAGVDVIEADVTDEIEQARQDERRRLARELHDTLGQTLSSAALFARSLEADGVSGPTAGTLRRLVDRALAETRTIMWSLRPVEVVELGLSPALHALADVLQRRHGVRVDVTVSGVDDLGPAEEAAAYRVAQEAMTNAMRHGDPSVVSVVVHRQGSTLTVVVDDDGAGFSSPAGARGAGAGIPGMRERAAELGGRLDIVSSPGRGTTVRLLVPCDGSDRP